MSRAGYKPLQLVERIDYTPQLASMRFRPEVPLAFEPGQYATIAVEDGPRLIRRAYSIVSAPSDPLLELFIELVPNGVLTPRLFQLAPGDRVLLRDRAAGHFTLVEHPTRRRHLMAATVTGVAPFVSIARALTENGLALEGHRLAIIHGASRVEELGAYREELSALQREGLLEYVPTISRPEDAPSWRGEVGRVEDVLRKHADRLGFQHDVSIAYACGHPNMVDTARAILRRARFPEPYFREEKFFLSPAQAPRRPALGVEDPRPRS